jgi:AAA15 family ATPase/GTPase
MKLLRVVANNFKMCEDNISISFVPLANKTAEDKEFELKEIAENLFVFNTISFIGKNASGKTTIVDLLAVVYDIFSYFKIKNTIKVFDNWNKPINLDITFYHEGLLYRYLTELKPDGDLLNKNILFVNEKLYKKTYYKTKTNEIFNYDTYEELILNTNLPADTSILYEILKQIQLRGVYCLSDDATYKNYSGAFNVYKTMKNGPKIITKILKMFDEHLKNIEMINEDKFIISYTNNKKVEVRKKEMYDILSSGTTKGFGLFTFVVYSLISGADLVIDEIENHFHKALVENLINLYKDKSVNKHNATLIFTTHYCELLDLFNRSDNIYITKYTKKILLENMYKDYDFRPELSKSKKFYSNAFDTGVNYEYLMDFKKELMK